MQCRQEKTFVNYDHALVGFGHKSLSGIRHISPVLAPSATPSAERNGAGLLTSTVELHAEYGKCDSILTVTHAIDGIEFLSDTPLLLTIIVDQSDVLAVKDAATTLKRAKEAGVYFAIAVCSEEIGCLSRMESGSEHRLQPLVDIFIRVSKTAEHEMRTHAAARVALALLLSLKPDTSCICVDVADLMALTRRCVFANTWRVPLAQLDQWLSGKPFARTFTEMTNVTEGAMLSFGGCSSDALIEYFEAACSAFCEAVDTVAVDPARSASANAVATCYLDDALVDSVEIIVYVAVPYQAPQEIT